MNDPTASPSAIPMNYSDGWWYQNGFFYAIDVKTFMDSDGDGIGDFGGLIERIDYLNRLGVTCIWLLPFYQSSNRDNGYDVTDYYSIDDRLGTFGDFVRFLRKAHQRGIKVIIDLVVNHTSDEHPWFQQAREDPDSKYREYYVWSEDPPAPEKEPIFPSEESVWTYDEVADAHYYHRFYDFEPGLDHSNPAVREEVRKIIDFWLELGIDGFRIDATPIMIQKKGLESTELDHPHRILKDYRSFVSRRNPDAVLLGEAGGLPEEVRSYFGEGTGDEMQMLFNFVLTDYLFAALASGRSDQLDDGLETISLPPPDGQWVNFLRNLDELNLEWLSESERESVFQRFAPEQEMQIFGRGIRRRLAPMLEDRQLIELAYSLLFSLSGTPLIPYGDEIGMGDDLSLEGRDAVRTPMQWSDEPNAGFSTADPDDLIRPVISDTAFGYTELNVDAQRNDPESLFNWMIRAIGVRREHPTFGGGTHHRIDVDSRSALAHRIEGTHTIIAVHNFDEESEVVSLDTDRELVTIFGDGRSGIDSTDPVTLRLARYGYLWFRAGGLRSADE